MCQQKEVHIVDVPLPHPIVLLFVRNNDVVVFTATYYLLWKFLGKPLLPPVNSFESGITWFCWVGWSLISIFFQRRWPRCTFFPAVQVKSVCVYVNIRIKRKKMKIIHVMLGFFFHCTWKCSDCFPSHFEHLCWFVLLQLPPSTVAVYMASFLLFRGSEATAEERLGSYTGSPSLLTASLFKVFRSIHPTSYVTSHQHFTVSITKLFMELQRK